DEFQGIDDIALGFRHLCARLIAHKGVDIDIAEGNIVHEVQAHHHHPRDPKEDDVEAGNEHACRVAAFELLCLVRPAKSGKGPKGRGKPGVEDVLVPPDFNKLVSADSTPG